MAVTAADVLKIVGIVPALTSTEEEGEQPFARVIRMTKLTWSILHKVLQKNPAQP